MEAKCLASSSAGNCFILTFNIGNNRTSIMVECGLPYKKILAECIANGINLAEIKDCLITHAHSDHCKGAKDLYIRGFNIFGSYQTLLECGVGGTALENLKPTKINEHIAVMPFEVEHDIEDSFGFVIKTKDETVLFVNDCKYWKTNLINFKPDYVFIECNYDEKVVYAQLHDLKLEKQDSVLSEAEKKEANIKIKQHERNIESHMSLHGTLKNLSKLNLSKCKTIFLMHLSDRFANEYKMKNAVIQKFNINTYVCKKCGGIK